MNSPYNWRSSVRKRLLLLKTSLRNFSSILSWSQNYISSKLSRESEKFNTLYFLFSPNSLNKILKNNGLTSSQLFSLPILAKAQNTSLRHWKINFKIICYWSAAILARDYEGNFFLWEDLPSIDRFISFEHCRSSLLRVQKRIWKKRSIWREVVGEIWKKTFLDYWQFVFELLSKMDFCIACLMLYKIVVVRVTYKILYYLIHNKSNLICNVSN